MVLSIEYRYINMYIDIVDTVRSTADNSRYVDIVVSVTSHRGIGSNLQKINCVSMNYDLSRYNVMCVQTPCGRELNTL